jgi:3-phosphoshikimate 1-carboxyvinyltransferase
MKSYKIKPCVLAGSVTASPSKSQTRRAILFATMACGSSVIRNPLDSPDVEAMIDACRKLGAKITRYSNFIEIEGVSGKPKVPDDVINAGNSGQVLRFIAAIAALTEGYTVFTGDHSLRYNRPVKPLMDGLAQLGAECISTKMDDHAPIIIKGPLRSGITSLDGADSQPVSALLIAAAFLDGTTEIHVKNPGEKPWVNLTLSWLDRLGVYSSNENFEKLTVTGKLTIPGFNYTVPGDFSSIAYPLVAALITGSTITVNNIDMHDAQGDKKVIDALCKMGADIQVIDDQLRVGSKSKLYGCEIDVNDTIDAVTILAVAGCYAEGTTLLTNAAIARKKESDRLSTITSELRKMGADISQTQDSLVKRISLYVSSRSSYCTVVCHCCYGS